MPPRDGVVHSVCPHDCPDTCSLLSEISDGKLIRVRGNPRHPVTHGFICRKLGRAPERVYGADRLLHPLMRTGPKGAGQFRRASWEEAVACIAARWKSILTSDGPHAILPFFGSGTEGLVQGRLAGRRFFNRLGSLQLVRTICTRAGRTGYRHTMGSSTGADPTAISGARLVIAWGVNTASNNIHFHPFLREARENGALYAVINPVRVRGAESADRVLRPRPGSDAALALGMMHVIVAEGLHDRDFVARYTVGFEALQGRLADYPPSRVEALTDVPADEIAAFARLYAEHAPAFIYVGPGCQRHSNGGMTVRTIACLPALVGAWRHPGGGVYFPTSTVFPVDWTPLEGDVLRPNPPAGYNMIHLGRLLSEVKPPVRSLYVFNGNPAAVLYNQNLVRRGLARDDLFTVVHERYLTDTARYADVVLPATTQFEHADLLASYFHPSLLLNRPAVPPPGECRSNLETFAALAAALGFEDPCFNQDAADVIAEILAFDHPAIAGIDLNSLLNEGWAVAETDAIHHRFANGAAPDPRHRIRFYSETLAAEGRDPLPAYDPPKESREATPELFRRYPLQFLTPSAHSFLNSNHAHEAGALASETRPTLIVNPIDAEARGITDGDPVRIFNDRGDCCLHAALSDAVRPGVVVSSGQWWSRHFADGRCPNFTTPDFVADMGGGSAFNSNLVEVAKSTATPGHTQAEAVHAR
jgi:anaerobic selenocysteine-containing dehydrogenase